MAMYQSDLCNNKLMDEPMILRNFTPAMLCLVMGVSTTTGDRSAEPSVGTPGPQAGVAISGGTVAPIYLDSDHGTSSSPTSGDNWQVLKAEGGFVDNTAPSVDNTTLWEMQIDPMDPPKYWKLKAK